MSAERAQGRTPQARCTNHSCLVTHASCLDRYSARYSEPALSTQRSALYAWVCVTLSADVHWTQRRRIRLEARRAAHLTRLAHGRADARRPHLANLSPAGHRACAHPAGHDAAHAARLLRLSVDPLPGHVAGVVRGVRAALLRHRALRPRTADPRTRRAPSLGARFRRARSRPPALAGRTEGRSRLLEPSHRGTRGRGLPLRP